MNWKLKYDRIFSFSFIWSLVIEPILRALVGVFAGWVPLGRRTWNVLGFENASDEARAVLSLWIIVREEY